MCFGYRAEGRCARRPFLSAMSRHTTAKFGTSSPTAWRTTGGSRLRQPTAPRRSPTTAGSSSRTRRTSRRSRAMLCGTGAGFAIWSDISAYAEEAFLGSGGLQWLSLARARHIYIQFLRVSLFRAGVATSKLQIAAAQLHLNSACRAGVATSKLQIAGYFARRSWQPAMSGP